MVATRVGGGRYRLGPLSVRLTGGEPALSDAVVADGFGRLKTSSCLSLTSEGPLPQVLVTFIRWAGP